MDDVKRRIQLKIVVDKYSMEIFGTKTTIMTLWQRSCTKQTCINKILERIKKKDYLGLRLFHLKEVLIYAWNKMETLIKQYASDPSPERGYLTMFWRDSTRKRPYQSVRMIFIDNTARNLKLNMSKWEVYGQNLLSWHCGFSTSLIRFNNNNNVIIIIVIVINNNKLENETEWERRELTKWNGWIRKDGEGK